MTHKHKLRPSFNPAARLMGDKWVCKLCGNYFDYDEMMEIKKKNEKQK